MLIVLIVLIATSLAQAQNHGTDAVAVSADGQTAWVSDRVDKTVRVFDLASHALIRQLAVPEAIMFRKITVGANGTTVVADSSKSYVFAADGTLTTVDGCAVVNASGTRLVAASGAEVKVFDLPSMTEVRTLATGASFQHQAGIDLSPDGRFVAVGTGDYAKSKTIEVYDLQDGSRLGAAVGVGESGDVEIAPDGRRVAFAPYVGNDKAQPVAVYDTPTGKRLHAFAYERGSTASPGPTTASTSSWRPARERATIRTWAAPSARSMTTRSRYPSRIASRWPPS